MHSHPSSPHHLGTRTIALLAASLATVAAAILLSGAPAHAATPLPGHVHVDGTATAGTTATLTFTVPDESATASTVSLEVRLPADTPLTSVRPLAKPGWTVEVVKSDLNPPVVVGGVAIKSYVSAVRWTATTSSIGPGQYDTFTIQAGAIPSGVASLELPAIQGYSDGTTVSWSDPPAADGSEPAHPAPVIEVTGGPGLVDEPDLAISVTALVLGALGLVAGVLAILLRRRSA